MAERRLLSSDAGTTILDYLKQLPAPAAFTHVEKTRRARWLNTFCLAFTVAVITLVSLLPLANMSKSQTDQVLFIVAILLGVNATVIVMVRRGFVEPGGWLISIASLIMVTYTIIVFDGIRSSMVVGYFVIVAVVSLFLQGWATFVFLVLNILTLTIVYVAEQQGVVTPAITPQATLDDLMVLIVALCLNTVVLQLLLSTVVSSAEEARRTAVALADSNWELQASQAALQQLHSELEERVGLRTTELSQANLELQRQISERQRTEAALNESELRFNAIFNHTLGFTAIMSPDGTLIDVNQAPLEAGGFNREEVLGRPFWETGWWRGLPEEQSTLKASIVEAASGQPVRGETAYLAANGTRRFAERVLHPIKDDDGHVKFLIAEGLDITERKRAEEALRQAQKTESLGVLAGGVAHDFNNLLVAILGQTSLAQAILPEENRAYAHIEKAAKAAKRAADLTRQLLAYSGRGQFEARPLNLNVLIQENLHLFEVAIPKHIHLRSQLAQPLPLIEADTGQMQQIIMNLILNAVEAIGDQRGTIMVGTGIHRITDEDRSYGQSGGEPLAVGSYVTLEITDNGIGMDASTLTRIFDPFFTTKPTGRGLGLAAVLGIVRGHKGELQVHSQVGNGTTFKVLLPALALNMTPAVLATANEVGRRGSQGLILVIDDEAPVREAVADILGLEGITVLTAANGATGIELYRQSMDDVKLVILDLSLPGLSGAEIFRELRRMDPAVKVLLSSGYDQVEATRHFIGQGLAGFLQKPYESEGLVEKVRSYL